MQLSIYLDGPSRRGPTKKAPHFPRSAAAINLNFFIGPRGPPDDSRSYAFSAFRRIRFFGPAASRPRGAPARLRRKGARLHSCAAPSRSERPPSEYLIQVRPRARCGPDFREACAVNFAGPALICPRARALAVRRVDRRLEASAAYCAGSRGIVDWVKKLTLRRYLFACFAVCGTVQCSLSKEL